MCAGMCTEIQHSKFRTLSRNARTLLATASTVVKDVFAAASAPLSTPLPPPPPPLLALLPTRFLFVLSPKFPLTLVFTLRPSDCVVPATATTIASRQESEMNRNCMYVSMCTDGWMDGWMEGWMDGCFQQRPFTGFGKCMRGKCSTNTFLNKKR